jgi:hypothetical protein
MQKISSCLELLEMLKHNAIIVLEARGYKFVVAYGFKRNGMHYTVSFFNNNTIKHYRLEDFYDDDKLPFQKDIRNGYLQLIALNDSCYPIIAESIVRYWIAKDKQPQFGQALISNLDAIRLKEILITSGTINEPLYFLNQYSDSSFESKSCVQWFLHGKIIRYCEVQLKSEQ